MPVSNDLTVVTPKILAQGLLALRSATVMPLLVNRDYGREAQQKGSTVTIPIPSAIAAQQVAPSEVPPATGNIVPTSALIPLDQWYEAPFSMTDKDIQQAMTGTLPMQATEAVKALAENVNAYILSKYKGVYGYVGTAGTIPFATAGNVTDATNLRKALNVQLCPMNPRAAVLDPDAEANALNQRAFQDASFGGGASAILEGQINRKMGFGWFMDQQVPTHTAGTVGGSPAVNDASTDVGQTTIAFDGGTSGSFLEGDIITFAGHTQTYVVTADTAYNAGTLPIAPALQAVVADDAAITIKADHVVNLGFHRDAFAFASRPLADVPAPGVIMSALTDPLTGISMRLEVTRQHKQTRWSYDILYGAGLVRRELAARLAG